MNYSIEEKIVNRFFVKNKAERVLFELKSSKKRRTCIWRINREMMNEKYCYPINSKISSPYHLAEFLLGNGASEMCYVLSIDESIDGRNIPLLEAVNKVYGCGPALLFFDDIQMLYLECEHEVGTTDRYLLR